MNVVGLFLVFKQKTAYEMLMSDLSSDVCSSDLQAFLDAWFGSRQALRGLVVVMDIRHPLKDYDRQMIGYAVRRGLPAHALLTKADKLGRGAQGSAVLAVRRELSSAYGDKIGRAPV